MAVGVSTWAYRPESRGPFRTKWEVTGYFGVIIYGDYPPDVGVAKVSKYYF